MVTEPFVRHPSLTACAVATIADISGGRVVLGMSTGYPNQPPYWGENRRKPLTALREAVRVTRAMWSGETVDFEGEVIRCRKAKLGFPVQHKIPILIAGRSPKTIELAGEIADIIHFAPWSASRERYIDNLSHTVRGLEKGGRRHEDVEIDISLTSCVCGDAEKALEPAKRYAAIAISWDAGMEELPPQFSAPEAILEEASQWRYWTGEPMPDRLATLLTKDIIEQFTVSGASEQVAERYREIMDYLHLGASEYTPFQSGASVCLKAISRR